MKNQYKIKSILLIFFSLLSLVGFTQIIEGSEQGSSNCPEIAVTPVITKYCEYTRITKGFQEINFNTVYYWQNTSSGSSTSNSERSIDRTTGTVYYLRGKNTQTNCWGPVRTINYTIDTERTWYLDADRDGYAVSTRVACSSPGNGYTLTLLPLGDYNDTTANITNIPPQHFYKDSDNDGLGDPNDKVYYSIKPAGYVTNNTDLCPNESGEVANNGCPSNDSDTIEPFNTVLTITYNANGESTSKTKSYADNLGRPIQTQSLDILTNKVWANQTLYDDQGRAVIQTLSAPVNTDGHILYKEDFILKTDGSSYNVSDFENNPDTPPVVGNQSSTLGWYYSESNTSEAYQDVTDYPFSGTIYSTLNPGTILRTAGGTKVSGAWPQSYVFSMPASQELSQGSAFNDLKYNTTKTIKTISRDVHGVENVVFADTDGKVLASARSGGTVTRTMTIPISEQGFIDLHVPSGNNMGFSIATPTGISVTIHDLISETTTSAAASMPNSFYRISVNDLENYDAQTNPVIITYKENYYDYSLNEYDKTGRLISSKQPLIHLESTFEYNTLGQLIHSSSPDEGEVWFKYRKDGQIRYSQNSKQRTAGEFSYTNYDSFGRPIEGGVIINNGFSTTNPDAVLPSGSKKEQVLTTYDVPDLTGLNNALGNVSSHYTAQNFVSGNVSSTQTLNPTTTTSWYSYDIYGRVEWIVQKINGLGTKTIDYEYDPVSGSVTKVYFQRHNTAERFIHRYTYNPQDYSLVQVETSIDDINYTTHADYTYYETGALKRMELGGGIQGVDYVYNLAGQLKSINHPSLNTTHDPGGDANDLFGMAIDYHQSDYMRGLNNIKSTTYGTDQLNGNIKGIRWNNGYQPLQGAQNVYSYQYDRNNWLTDAQYGEYNAPSNSNIPPDITKNSTVSGTQNYEATNSIRFLPGFKTTSGTVIKGKIINADGLQENNNGDYNVSGITYDANGNIQTLHRNKNTEDGNNAMDDLSYTYKTDKPNQLLRVDDTVTSTTNVDDIKDQNSDNYIYNGIGQLVENVSENVKYVYNTAGLITEVRKNNQTLVKFFYNGLGHRLRKESIISNYTEHYVRDFTGKVMVIYRDNQPAEYPIYGSERIGVYKKEGATSYQLTDHLGNVRAVVGNNGDLTSSSDYYPFGMVMPNKSLTGSEEYRYAYQGQEKDPETGKESFQLRLWDGRIGRWLTTDPYGEFSSPYLGMGNNPISLIDPDGGMTQVGDPPSVSRKGIDTSIPKPLGFVEGEWNSTILLSGIVIRTGIKNEGIYRRAYAQSREQWSAVPMFMTELITTVVPVGGAAKVFRWGAKLISKSRNAKLISKAAIRAEAKFAKTKGPAWLLGIRKHAHATKILRKYQGIYGDKGLRTNVYFKGSNGRGFLDVIDRKNGGIIYDWKFMDRAIMTGTQYSKYSNHWRSPFIKLVNRAGKITNR
ncbi:RHS repeat-associated core domain-containing protein [uncultured Aquimarina sp.]|uniref:RHS repeat domain-containing protein n=1 Tax=uncultured Aquimarina sp. TaxID=575652 RepID=UPI00262149FA|nr:RHS repeat-associated core domain-containing protein [uncultured Aquimarina sp.]